jgi:hypothetical protein
MEQELVEWGNLMDRIGFNLDTIVEIGSNGIIGFTPLIELSKEELNTTLNSILKYPHPTRPPGAVVYISVAARQNLYAAVQWAKIQMRLGLLPRSLDLTNDAMVGSKLRIQELAAFRMSEGKQDIAKPTKLKEMSEWLKFWEATVTYFGSIRGAADIPISYVFRDTLAITQADRDADYHSTDAKLIRCTVLQGTHFNADNVRVWNEWKVLVQDGPGWDFCKRFEGTQNGREAVLILRRQQESMTGITSRKNIAYTALESLAFSGPRRDWTFEQYVNGHLAAHNTLEQCGEPVAPAKKVKDFLDNISDDRLSNAKDLVYGDDNLMVDFEATQQKLTLILTKKSTADRSQKRRGARIGEVTTNKHQKVEDRNYDNDEWWALTKEQRGEVSKLRKKKGNNGGKAKKEKEHKKRFDKAVRKAAAAAVAKQDKADSPASSEDEEETKPVTKDAGKQFGRDAHGKQSKKKTK